MRPSKAHEEAGHDPRLDPPEQRKFIERLQSLVPDLAELDAVVLGVALGWGKPAQEDPVLIDTPADYRTHGATITSFVAARDVRAQPAPGLADSFSGQFAVGEHVLTGRIGRYRIVSPISVGESSETYRAEVIETSADSGIDLGAPVVIKVPRVSPDVSDEAATARLIELEGALTTEAKVLRRLAGVRQAAQVVDVGEYSHRLRFDSALSVFIVQQFVDGDGLDEVMQRDYPAPGTGTFAGIRDPRKFFDIARRLTEGLVKIHRCLVIHGDIRPGNILIDRSGEPVFVDFGQGVITQKMSASNRHARYKAPEGSPSVGADVFSLGAVFFYLATGDAPPLPHEDKELVKKQIDSELRTANQELCKAGVSDIVARCLRYSHAGRVECASRLLRDIETFDDVSLPDRLTEETKELVSSMGRLDASENAVFRWIAVLRARQMREVLDDMAAGAYDVSGDVDELIEAASRLLSVLGPGDRIRAVAAPQFWWPFNIGVNGRYLAMNQMAADRGVDVDRIFIMDPASDDPHLHDIIEAQERVLREFKGSPKYRVRYVIKSAKEQQSYVEGGRHFAYIERRGFPVAMFPEYRDNGQLVTLRFRAGHDRVRGLQELFREIAEGAKPMSELQLRPRRSTGSQIA